MLGIRPATAASLLLMLAVWLHPGLGQSDVNGGRNCKYYDYRAINEKMRGRGIADAALIQKAINNTSFVNGWLCASCRQKRMQMQNFGVVDPDRGECWCAPGYGYFEIKKSNGYIKSRGIGCSKCKPAGTTTNPTSGPYNPTRRTWTQTVCA